VIFPFASFYISNFIHQFRFRCDPGSRPECRSLLCKYSYCGISQRRNQGTTY
jgi:hypothetical protein